MLKMLYWGEKKYQRIIESKQWDVGKRLWELETLIQEGELVREFGERVSYWIRMVKDGLRN